MSLEVVVENLRAAADTLRRTTEPMAGYELDVADLGAEQVGHVELAAWLEAVVDQCTQAGQALRDGAVTLADTLDRTARDFERTDQCVAVGFGPTPSTTPAPFWQPFPWPPPSSTAPGGGPP